MKIIRFAFLSVSLFIINFSFAQPFLIQNVSGRNSTSLNGKWNYIIDPYELGYYDYRYQPRDQHDYFDKGAFFNNAKPENKSDLVEYDFDLSPTLLVPRDWNTQDEKLFYYEGTIWYRKMFDYKKSGELNRVFVHFGGANYRADVYLNGKKLGSHKGGFTPFNFEITGQLKEKDNFLVVKVDDKRAKDEVPTVNTDWWNYGGITRDVNIVEVPQTFIPDYRVQLKKGSDKTINGFVKLDGTGAAGKNIELVVPELNLRKKFKTNPEGISEFEFSLDNIKLWSPENPYLYDVKIISGADTVNDRIGFRSVEVKGHDIFINGKSVFLRGISAHEENPLRDGRNYCREDAELLINWAKELGCNFMRLAHYPHNEYMAKLADEKGILLWEEIPVYWTIEWENSGTLQNAENQLTELISRDKNRASVIIWSMANETPVSEPRMKFLKILATKARELDNTRLISAALEQSRKQDDPAVRVISDPFADIADVLSFNEYIGWYEGLPDNCANVKWEININKPVIISELGAGALYGFHGDSLTRWTEEFQEYFYRENLKMVGRISQLRGMTPWILADFRSPRRPLPVIQDGWNRKGLISEQGFKKKAYFELQQFYKKMSEKYPDR